MSPPHGPDRRGGLLAAVLVALSVACGPPEHQESFGWMLETRYHGVTPKQQRAALHDHRVTRTEVAQAHRRSRDCMLAVPGVAWVERFAWVDDINFTSGGIRVAPGYEEADVVSQTHQCYYRYVALIETAWLDQAHFGRFTTENHLDT